MCRNLWLRGSGRDRRCNWARNPGDGRWHKEPPAKRLAGGGLRARLLTSGGSAAVTGSWIIAATGAKNSCAVLLFK
jgi:hypothetical protein